jgi:hypothetical protein
VIDAHAAVFRRLGLKFYFVYKHKGPGAAPDAAHRSLALA